MEEDLHNERKAGKERPGHKTGGIAKPPARPDIKIMKTEKHGDEAWLHLKHKIPVETAKQEQEAWQQQKISVETERHDGEAWPIGGSGTGSSGENNARPTLDGAPDMGMGQEKEAENTDAVNVAFTMKDLIKQLKHEEDVLGRRQLANKTF